MGFDFSPALWFLCRKCEVAFPNIEELKQHKLETHLGDCLGTKCIIFEEIHHPNPQLLFQLSNPIAASDPSSSSSSSHLTSSNGEANAKIEATGFATLIRETSNACTWKGIHILKNPFVAMKPLTQEEINRATQNTDLNSLHGSTTKRESQSILNQQSISDDNLRIPDLKERTYHNCLNLNESVSDQNLFQMQTDLPKSFANDIHETVFVIKDESPPPSTTSVEEIITHPLSQELSAQPSILYPGQDTSQFAIHDIPSSSERNDDGNESKTSIEICMEIFPVVNKSPPILNRCKLCRTPLATADQAKNHEENCLLHNKDRHIYCLCCEREFKTPMKLKKHLIKHNELQVISPDSKLLQDSDDDDDDEIDEEKDDLLPIGQWIEKRRRNFSDIILLHPEVPLNSEIKGSCSIKCKLCTLQLATVDELKEHVKMCWVYNKRNHLYCLPCKKSLVVGHSLICHNRIHHPFKPLRLPSVYCAECYKEFNNIRELREHEESARVFFRAMMGNKGAVTVQSNIAVRNATTNVTKRRYTKNDDIPIDPIPCRLCREKQVTKSEVSIHRRNCLIHNKDRHVYCLGCQTLFKNPLMLTRHQDQNRVVGQSQNHCGPINSPEHIKWAEAALDKMENEPECITLTMDLDLDLYANLPLGLWVLKMRKQFPDKILLYPDPSTGKNLLSPKPITNLQPITCGLCRRKLSLESHIKFHVLVCWAYNKENHRYCFNCQITYKNTEALRKHWRTHHSSITPQLPSFFCDECHGEFGTQSNLDKHVDSTKQFYCSMRMKVRRKLEKYCKF